MNKKDIRTQSQEIFPIVIITLLLDSLFIIIDNKTPTPTRKDYPDPKKKLGAWRRVHRKLESFFI